MLSRNARALFIRELKNDKESGSTARGLLKKLAINRCKPKDEKVGKR